MTSTIERCAAPDGLPLARRRWTTAEPRALVVLVHGLGEHSGRYEHVGQRLAAAGFEVVAADLRGFGASGGPRAFVESWSQLHDDLEAQVCDERASHPGLPLVLYGHSLGGLVALGYVVDGRTAPDLLVLSSPALGDDVPGWKRAVARVLGSVAPRVRVANALRDSDLSCDPQVGLAYRADPLNVHSSTTRLGREAFGAQAAALARLDALTVPTLVIHGSDDRIVPPEASAPLERIAGVTRRVYPGGRHELHNEPGRDGVIDDVIAWVGAHVGSAVPEPTGPASDR